MNRSNKPTFNGSSRLQDFGDAKQSDRPLITPNTITAIVHSKNTQCTVPLKMRCVFVVSTTCSKESL